MAQNPEEEKKITMRSPDVSSPQAIIAAITSPEMFQVGSGKDTIVLPPWADEESDADDDFSHGHRV